MGGGNIRSFAPWKFEKRSNISYDKNQPWSVFSFLYVAKTLWNENRRKRMDHANLPMHIFSSHHTTMRRKLSPKLFLILATISNHIPSCYLQYCPSRRYTSSICLLIQKKWTGEKVIGSNVEKYFGWYQIVQHCQMAWLEIIESDILKPSLFDQTRFYIKMSHNFFYENSTYYNTFYR